VEPDAVSGELGSAGGSGGIGLFSPFAVGLILFGVDELTCRVRRGDGVAAEVVVEIGDYATRALQPTAVLIPLVSYRPWTDPRLPHPSFPAAPRS
jgi:hypothetical protein